eukprot:748735-Hanusia_phi.AAC.2
MRAGKREGRADGSGEERENGSERSVGCGGDSAASNYSTIRRQDDDEKFHAKDGEIENSSSEENVESGEEAESGDDKAEMSKMIQRVKDLENQLRDNEQELEMERKKNADMARGGMRDSDDRDEEEEGEQDQVTKLQRDIEEMNGKLVAMTDKNKSLSAQRDTLLLRLPQLERLSDLLQESNADYEELLLEHEKDLHKSSVALNVLEEDEEGEAGEGIRGSEGYGVGGGDSDPEDDEHSVEGGMGRWDMKEGV